MNIEQGYEEKILSLLLRDPNTVSSIRETLPESYFLNPQLRGVYREILGYFETSNGLVPTQEILGRLLEKAYPKNVELYQGLVAKVLTAPLEPTDAQHLPFYVRTLEETWQASVMNHQMMEAISHLKNKDITQALAALQKDWPIAKDQFIQGNISNDLFSAVEDLDERAAHPEKYRGIPIGFPSIDSNTHGHGKGELIVVIGGTGVGKSLTLGQVAVNVAKQRKKVLLVTVENDRRSYMHRLYSNLCKVPYWKFKTAQMDKSDRDTWLKAMADLPDEFYLQIVEFPEGCSSRDIWYYMRTLPEQVDYLVVDQITNMVPNDQEDLKPLSWTWFGQIALDLKRLAGYAYNNQGIPILTAAQAAGGTVGKKELSTDDVAMAKAILHHAHAGLYVTRDGNDFNMGASKYRDARIDVFPVFPEFKYWTISEMPMGMGGHSVDDRPSGGGYQGGSSVPDHTPPPSSPTTSPQTPAPAPEPEPDPKDFGDTIPEDEVAEPPKSEEDAF